MVGPDGFELPSYDLGNHFQTVRRVRNRAFSVGSNAYYRDPITQVRDEY